MKIKFHAGTTVRPCATPATASVQAGITLPSPSSTEEVCLAGSILAGCCGGGFGCVCAGTCATLDGHIDTMVSTALAALDADEVEYDSSTNQITVTLSAEAGITKDVEVPIQKWGVADFLRR